MRNSIKNKNSELSKSGKILKCFTIKLRVFPASEQVYYLNMAFGCSIALEKKV